MLKCFLCDLRVLEGKPASSFGHPAQVSTQVELASTCDYLLVRLARALKRENNTIQVVKPWLNGLASRCKFSMLLASTCDNVWPGLYT